MLIDLNVVRAVHWLQDVRFIIDLISLCVEAMPRSTAAIMRGRPIAWLIRLRARFDHRWEYAVAIFIPVAAGLVEFDLANMGRYHWQVAAVKLFLAQETLKQVTQDSSFGQPERQP